MNTNLTAELLQLRRSRQTEQLTSAERSKLRWKMRVYCASARDSINASFGVPPGRVPAIRYDA